MSEPRQDLVERAEAPLAAAPDREPTLLEIISKAAMDPAVDVEKLERLMALSERVGAKNAEQSFNAAMTLAQSEMGRIAADAKNTQTNTRYASYAALDRVVRPIYTKHGFALSFDTGPDAATGHVRVLCHVSHSGGHGRTYQIDMPADGKGAKGGDVMTKTHATGAAMSYGSRYLLKLIFNVAVGEDDDDGNGAEGNEPINAEQLQELNAMLGKCDGDPEKFVKYMKVSSMGAILQKDIGKAREALNLAINDYERKNPKGKAK